MEARAEGSEHEAGDRHAVEPPEREPDGCLVGILQGEDGHANRKRRNDTGMLRSVGRQQHAHLGFAFLVSAGLPQCQPDFVCPTVLHPG